MGQLLSNLASGSLVKLMEDSKPTKFIKLNNGHYDIGTGVALIRRDTFSKRQWRASYDSGYNNRYIGCLLDNFCDGIRPLELNEEIRERLVPVPIVVAEGNQVATLHTIYHKDLALSYTKVGISGWQTESKAFGYFSDSAKRITYLDEMVTAARWGLRFPYSLGSVVYSFDTGGTMNSSGVYRADFAPRPVFNLKSSIVVSDSTDSNGCYAVENVPDNDGGLYMKNNGLRVKAI